MKTSHIPNNPWVYMFKAKSWKILYIWKAKDLKKRVEQYFNKNIWVWKEDMISKSFTIDFYITQTEQEALILENNLIKKYQPRYNTLLKWDNSYTYIKITNEDFPKIILTRFKDNDNAIYIGPKTYRQDLKKILQFLRQFFLFRNCSKTQFKQAKLCSDYTFWLCAGWCNKSLYLKNWQYQIDQNKTFLNQEIQKNREELVEMYNNNMKLIIDFFNWKTDSVENKILVKMQDAIDKENYERAWFLRDIYKNIRNYTQKQTIELSYPITWYFYKISYVWSWYIFVFLKFYRWKLVDIVKHKENENDANFSLLKEKFEWEFDKMYTIKKTKDIRIACSYDVFVNDKENLNKSYDDIIWLLDNMIQSLIISTSMEKENLMNDILKNIQDKYFLNNYPYNIECLDISHFSGSWISGGISSMSCWILSKKNYRMYKINSIEKWKSDDYKSIKEVLIRRFKNSSSPWPDLFIIDGAKGQIWVIKDLVQKDNYFWEVFEKVDFISIWKWIARKVSNKIIWEKEKIFVLSKNLSIKSYDLNYDESDKLLVKIRDEAHRFSNKYRKKQMSNEWKY